MRKPIPQINGNNESKIRKVLFNEVSFIVAVIGTAIAMFVYVTNPAAENQREITALRTEVESSQKVLEKLNQIRDNDLHTLEGKLEDSNRRLNEIENQLIELKAILNERLPAKQ